MNENKNNTLDARQVVSSIRTSEAFVRAQNDPETQNLSDIDRLRLSVMIAGDVLKEAKPSGYLSPEGHAFNVTARLTNFTEGLRELRELDAVNARGSEKIPAKRKIAEFNHAVKSMIDSNPSLSYSNVLSFILTMSRSINGPIPQFEDEVRGVLVGMRHEIAFEQMLGYMPDVDYRESEIDEDLKGADIYVSIDGSPMTPIDVKASPTTAERAREKASSLGYNSNKIVWSHVNDEEFNGTFRIPNEVAYERSADLYASLQEIINPQSKSVSSHAS